MRRGFSLIEILVTLAILGLAIAVTAPTIGGIYDAVRFRSTAETIASSVSSMKIDAAISNRPLVFPRDYGAPSPAAHIAAHEPIPEGWRLGGDEIAFLPAGVCSGGMIEIADDSGRIARYRLSPPSCDAVLAEQ